LLVLKTKSFASAAESIKRYAK